jgi:8-amino-7-oxononanoate synthase
LVFGSHDAHLALERELAAWVGTPAALHFSSGYAANVSWIPALVGPGDTVFSDQLNHASLIDGCRLSRADVRVFPHLDLTALDSLLAIAPRTGRRLIVVETLFSMDGDSPDLPALAKLARRHDAWLALDEAHALGIYGPEGAGLARASGVCPDVLVGTLGKAVGRQGAFVAGSTELVDWLYNRALGFVFSTAPSPAFTDTILEAVRRVRAADEARQRLAELSERFAERLRALHLPIARNCLGPIFPLLLGTPQRALAVAARLRERGFLAQAIRPPTVPEGASRLRITLSAALSDAQVEELLASLEAVLCAE